MSNGGRQSPRLTLVVTAHHGRFLTEALISIAAQINTGFVVVCCADTTGEPQVAQIFEQCAPFLHPNPVQILAVPAGTAGAIRNAGFAAADTPWVAYLDGDDLLRPDALARMLEAADAHPEAGLLSSGMARIHAEGTVEELPSSLTYRPPRWLYDTDPDQVGHATFFNQLLMMRRELWAAHPFDATTNGEDIDFMLHQLLRAPFRKVPHALYYYRDLPGSFSKRTYPGGDLCTRRYQDGYYARLFATAFDPALAGNFSDAPVPPGQRGG